ncbi:hypothetical protein ACHAWF_005988 [Thalassiosira exigua]
MMTDTDSESDTDADEDGCFRPRQRGGRESRAIHREGGYSFDNVSDSDVVYSDLGRVFSDEDSSSEDSSSGESDFYNGVKYYDEGVTDDEKDYEMWRSYQRD